MKKRARSLFSITVVAWCASAGAANNLPQACADAAFAETGETNFEVIKSRQMIPGIAWYELVLSSNTSELEVTCQMRRGKVKRLNTDNYHPFEEIPSEHDGVVVG